METEEFLRRELDRFQRRADSLDKSMREIERSFDAKIQALEITVTEIRVGAGRASIYGGSAGGIVFAVIEGIQRLSGLL